MKKILIITGLILTTSAVSAAQLGNLSPNERLARLQAEHAEIKASYEAIMTRNAQLKKDLKKQKKSSNIFMATTGIGAAATATTFAIAGSKNKKIKSADKRLEEVNAEIAKIKKKRLEEEFKTWRKNHPVADQTDLTILDTDEFQKFISLNGAKEYREELTAAMASKNGNASTLNNTTPSATITLATFEELKTKYPPNVLRNMKLEDVKKVQKELEKYPQAKGSQYEGIVNSIVQIKTPVSASQQSQFYYQGKFVRGIAKMKREQAGLWGYVKKDGTVLVEPAFGNAEDFKSVNGTYYAEVKNENNTQCGKMDEFGNLTWYGEVKEGQGCVEMDVNRLSGYEEQQIEKINKFIASKKGIKNFTPERFEFGSENQANAIHGKLDAAPPGISITVSGSDIIVQKEGTKTKKNAKKSKLPDDYPLTNPNGPGAIATSKTQDDEFKSSGRVLPLEKYKDPVKGNIMITEGIELEKAPIKNVNSVSLDKKTNSGEEIKKINENKIEPKELLSSEGENLIVSSAISDSIPLEGEVKIKSSSKEKEKKSEDRKNKAKGKSNAFKKIVKKYGTTVIGLQRNSIDKLNEIRSAVEKLKNATAVVDNKSIGQTEYLILINTAITEVSFNNFKKENPTRLLPNKTLVELAEIEEKLNTLRNSKGYKRYKTALDKARTAVEQRERAEVKLKEDVARLKRGVDDFISIYNNIKSQQSISIAATEKVVNKFLKDHQKDYLDITGVKEISFEKGSTGLTVIIYPNTNK